MDNLESATYEVFERDTVKYTTYEEAVYHALLRRSERGLKKTVLMVVGAGRGPLVRASLKAAKRAGVLSSVQVSILDRFSLVYLHHIHLRTCVCLSVPVLVFVHDPAAGVRRGEEPERHRHSQEPQRGAQVG